MLKATSVTTPMLGLPLTLKQWQPGARLDWHEHGDSTMCVVSRGQVVEDMGDGEQLHEAGDIVFKPAGIRHRNRFGSAGASVLTLAIGGTILRQLTDARVPLSTSFAGPLEGTSALIRNLTLAARGGFALRAEALALQLLAALCESRSTSSASKPAISHLRETVLRASGEAAGARHLARAAGVTTAELARFIKATSGVSVREYRQRVRIEEAADKLAQGNPINAVALDLRYYDQSHFTRTFKRVTGVTPGAFRKAHSPGNGSAARPEDEEV